MIHDTLANAARYAALDERFAAAFRWLAALDETQADGRLTIAGEELFAVLMSYDTKAPVDRTQEAHRRYADLQVMLHGEERIQFTPAETLGAGNGYHAEKDYELFDSPAEHSTLRLRAGEFAIFFPGEGHKPSLVFNEPAHVRKVVVKVRI
jgi:YhcH/YjgK/YiaL family protein